MVEAGLGERFGSLPATAVMRMLTDYADTQHQSGDIAATAIERIFTENSGLRGYFALAPQLKDTTRAVLQFTFELHRLVACGSGATYPINP